MQAIQSAFSSARFNRILLWLGAAVLAAGIALVIVKFVGGSDNNPDLVVEHNVLRGGEWVLRECVGEVRYNLIADMNGHAWIKGPHTCNIHHNVFVNYANEDHNSEGGIDIVYLVNNLNIYNNTFDGGRKIGVAEVTIDANGKVVDVKPMLGLSPAADRMIADALSRWEFKPATRAGQPVAVVYNVTLSLAPH